MSIGRNDSFTNPAIRAGRGSKAAKRTGVDRSGRDAICVQEFGRRHDLSRSEIRRLNLLFGASATASELQANARGPSRTR
jgi:hypothetical protein